MEVNGSTQVDSDHFNIYEENAIATFLGIVLVVGVTSNMFVLLYTIFHPKSLKESSILFLLGSSIMNLVVLLSYIPAHMVTVFTEEWVFGRNEEEKRIECQINGFFTEFSLYGSIYILALISVDKFFLLVKPQTHKDNFTPMSSCLMLLLTFAISTIQPIIDIALDRIEFGEATGVCLPTRDQDFFITASLLVTLTPIVTIGVTTVWTFLFTNQFKCIRHDQVDIEIESDLYTKQIFNFFGMFSLLLISGIIAFIPLGISIILSNAIGRENIPFAYGFSTGVVLYFSCITNPLIQCYFRKDLSSACKSALVRIICCRSLTPSTTFVDAEN